MGGYSSAPFSIAEALSSAVARFINSMACAARYTEELQTQMTS
jgi:hypothetical protein